MDGSEIGYRRRVGSVREAVNFYGERIGGNISSPSLNKTKMDFSEKPSSSARELHKARSHIGRYKESRWAAESAKAEAESELSNAKKTVKDLSSMIEESSFKANDSMQDMETLAKTRKSKARALVVRRNETCEFAEVMRELKLVKQELCKLKLDVSSVLEIKSRAEKEIKASSSRMMACSRTAQVLRKEIEEGKEEHLLAELARIEALKELGDIEAQREKEANEISSTLESTRKKLKEASEEIYKSKELEIKLAVTMSDVEVLQNELKLLKKMEQRVKRNEIMKRFEGSSQEGEDSGTSLMLHTIIEELEAAKKELASIREEGFQFMASMDVIRNELKHVTVETVRLKKEEAKVDSTVKSLNSKLLRAKSKLESLSAAEEKAKLIAINLSRTLDKLKRETEAAKKEKDLTSEEVTIINEEIQKAEFVMDITEERLQGAMQELEATKSSEALAFEKLKKLAENSMRDRALAAQQSSFITISKFEYEYLTNHAAAAKGIADKKVAAAQAWIEALNVSEKEIIMKAKIAQREIKEMEGSTKQLLFSRRVRREELEDRPRKREKSSAMNLQRTMSRKSNKSSGSLTPARLAKFQKSASPAARHVSPFTIKRKKVIPSLAKLFKGKKNTRILLLKNEKK